MPTWGENLLQRNCGSGEVGAGRIKGRQGDPMQLTDERIRELAEIGAKAYFGTLDTLEDEWLKGSKLLKRSKQWEDGCDTKDAHIAAGN